MQRSITRSGQLSPVDILKKFAACAICAGYCRESDRQEIADEIQGDIVKIVQLLQIAETEWIGALSDLARVQDDLWVKYFALICVGRVDPQKVVNELEALAATETGLVSAAARLAVFQLRRETPLP